MIAPNNELPATHFIEVWKSKLDNIIRQSIRENKYELQISINQNEWLESSTIAIFRIRLNKLPTKHKFI